MVDSTPTYSQQLKQFTFDTQSPSTIYNSTNKYFLIIEPMLEDDLSEGGLPTKAFIPAINVRGLNVSSSPIVIPYQGISIYAPGSVSQFNTLEFMIVDREDLLYRKFFHQWQSNIHNYYQNKSTLTSTNLRKVTLVVMDHDNKFLRSYILHYAFPARLDAIQLDWNNANQLGVYSVSMPFAYYERSPVSNVSDQTSISDLLGYVEGGRIIPAID